MGDPWNIAFALCVLSFTALCAKLWPPYPSPTHTFLKWRFLTVFEKHTHTPPPQGDDILVH